MKKMKAYDFMYDGKNLSDFGFVICNFGSKGLDTISNGSNITFNTVPSLGGTKHYLVSTQYEDCLETTIQICKASCDSDVEEISSIEFRNMTRWLNRKKFLKFKILEEDYIDLYFEASFNISRIEINGRLYGLELEVKTNRPFALKESKTFVINATSEYFWEKYNAEKKYNVVETYLGTEKPTDISDETPYRRYETTNDGHFLFNDSDFVFSSSDSPAYNYIKGQTDNPNSIYKYTIEYDANVNQYNYKYYILTMVSDYQKTDFVESVSSENIDTYPSNGMSGVYWYIYDDKKMINDGKYSINDISYEEGYIYPHTEITINEDGDLNIYNEIENRDTFIENCVAGEIITMDYPVIQSSISSHNIQNDFNWNFLRIANTYENSRNDLTISIPCTIKMEYSPIVKVGL